MWPFDGATNTEQKRCGAFFMFVKLICQTFKFPFTCIGHVCDLENDVKRIKCEIIGMIEDDRKLMKILLQNIL